MIDAANNRQALAEIFVALADHGLNQGTAGNVSVRQSDGLLITPTGAAAATITADKIVKTGTNGVVIGNGIASSEWAMHASILAHRPDLNAVIHCHADACTALSCLRRPLPAFHYMIAGFGGNNVRCSDYAPFGSDALAHAALRAIEGRSACLLANHGVIVCGPSLGHALQSAIKLETLARQYILACQAGNPVILSEPEMTQVRDRYGHYGTAEMPR